MHRMHCLVDCHGKITFSEQVDEVTVAQKISQRPFRTGDCQADAIQVQVLVDIKQCPDSRKVDLYPRANVQDHFPYGHIGISVESTFGCFHHDLLEVFAIGERQRGVHSNNRDARNLHRIGKSSDILVMPSIRIRQLA